MRYFSMFSGIGGFELGLENSEHNFKNIGYSEIDKYADSIYRKNFPEHKGYGDATKIDTRELPDFDLLVGGFPCFTKNTLIQTDKGILPIIDVKKGDKVLTHKNRYMPVVNKMVKQYNDIGYKIQLPFFGKDNSIECTDNHPFYVYNDGEPIWKEAKDLKEDDYCFVPINNEHHDDINFSFTKWINQHSSKTQDVVLDDEDWWWCVGYYIGDGWYQKRRKRNGKWQKTTRITLATNPKECEYVASRFSKFFKCNIQKDKRKIVFSNSCFYHFVKELGDKALEKRLPSDFDKYPIHILSALIDGYMYADGYENDKILGCSTISKQLAFQVFVALIKIYNTMPNFVYVETPDKTIIEGREVNQSNYYQVKVNTQKTKEPMTIKDDGIWIKIKKIEKYEINELVYNLEVENDNSYTANGIGVHNCQAFSIAGHRRGFDDTRGTLFFEIARILENKRPQYFLLENVRNLLSHDGGRTIKKIFKVLSEMDYYVESEIYNSKDYGVPQRRERIFIKGYYRGRGGRKILPFRKNSRKSMALKPIQLNNHKKTYQDGRIYSFDGASICLNARGNNGWYQVSDSELMPCTREGDAFALTTKNRSMPFKKHLDNYVVSSKTRIRKLTPIECERLQGFPTIERRIELWLSEKVRKSVQYVVEKWHKNPKLVGTVEKNKSQKNVSFVEKSSQANNQKSKKLVLKNVHINFEQKQIQLYNQEKSKSSAKTVEEKNLCHQFMATDNFAHLIVGMSIILERIIQTGKGELVQNEQWQIHQENGEIVAKLFGNETMPLVNSVEEGLTTMSELMKSITLDPSDMKTQDMMLTTLYSYVIGVIIGCIPMEIDISCLEKIEFNIISGWTEYGKDGELVSDTQRYKCIGNAVTTNVITSIINEMFGDDNE